jgi:signal transduction histidine kinase
MQSNETKIYIALLIIAVMLLIVITFFTITILRHRKRSLRLYKEKIAAEITTLETERQRMASDLHDDFGPHISAIKLQVASLDVAGEADKQMVIKIERHIDELVEKIRVTSNDLVPLVLERKGFNTAIRQFAGNINDTGQLNVTVTQNTDAEPSARVAIHLYRIIREMVTNTIRHGKASRSDITISLAGNTLQYSVTDDGIGFDYRELPGMSRGFGLQNILSRTEMMKARMFINTKPGKGVNYTIEIPYHVDETHPAAR